MYKSEKFWDRLVKNYDNEPSKNDEVHNKTIGKVKEYIKDGDVILDCGCAAGAICLEIAGNVRRAYGIDISSKMIQVAERKADELNIKNVNFEQSTVFNEKYDLKPFDVVLLFNILHLIDGHKMFLKRINSFLKPGGFIISSTACLREKKTFLTRFLFILAKFRLIPHINFFKTSELESLIAQENFEIIETEKNFQGPYSHLVVAKKHC